jgi:hypothetical protein
MSHWKGSPHFCSPGDQISAKVDIEEDDDPGDMVDDRLNPRIEEISRNRRI